MRTTLDLDDDLLVAARRRAAELGTTLTAVIESALAASLARQASGGPRFRLRWKPHRGRVMPGVDLADRDSLYDVMEARR